MNTRLLSTTVSVFTKALAFAALLLGIWEKGAVAQDSPQPILATQFSFSNPGARSLGLAGAFVALADDATAAWANPAGLVQITRPEVSVEGRYWEYSTPFVVGGRVTGEPSDVGLDTVSGLRTKDSESDATGLAFLSFVYPAERWSVAVYRHVFANLETQGETEGLFGGGTDCCAVRYLDQRNRSLLDIDLLWPLGSLQNHRHASVSDSDSSTTSPGSRSSRISISGTISTIHSAVVRAICLSASFLDRLLFVTIRASISAVVSCGEINPRGVLALDIERDRRLLGEQESRP